MSINVHVTGNPISIKRGKMVTSDFDQCKSEFEKRRLMRLEQVRQQSKDIAEGLRNKVKKEKKMQMKEIEEEGKQKLKNWQNRKLLDLQNQYQDALKELGVAHREAQTLGDENELLAEQDRVNKKKASKRGKAAGSKLCADKIQEEVEKARIDERRKLLREIEKTRAQMSPRAKRPKVKRHKSEGDISITICDSDESETQSDLSENGNIEESSSCSCDTVDSRASLLVGDASKKYTATKLQEEKPPPIVPPLHLSPDDTPTINPPPNSPRVVESKKSRPTPDTRISDRIKHRGIVYGETRQIKSPEPIRIPLIESRTDIRDFIHSRKSHTDCICCCKRRDHRKVIETENKQVETQFKDDRGTQTSDNNIPSHPPVKLKSSSSLNQQSKSSTKDRRKSGSTFQEYEHRNRVSSEKILPVDGFVEKIPLECLEFVIDPASEEDIIQETRRREKDAQIRGKKALEKEKLQRDYQEMLKKLPILQKKERVCEIYNDKPEYHMSEERLKEKERIKQNNLENVYNRLFPKLKPAIVTLPKTNQTKEDDLAQESSVHSLNVAEWDVDSAPNKFSSKEVQDIIKEFIKQKPRDRRAKLKELLKNLDIQKDELLNAISALPKTDSLDELINDLQSISDTDVRSKSKSSKSTRKRSRKADTSIDSNQETSSKDIAEESPRPGSGKSPRKKAKTKSRPTVIILQNTSTQTTPKAAKEVGKKSAATGTDQVTKEKICDKLHIPCDCNKENQDMSDEMCHIFIKLNDDDDPEVLVKAKDKEKSSNTVRTKHTTVGTQISPETTKQPSRRPQIPPEPSRKPPPQPKRKQPEPINRKPDVTRDRSRTWREQFSKNSISTTSTSYMSPPDFHRTQNSDKSSFYNLRSKPQQEELSSAFSSTRHESMEQSVDPLKPFVKQLLEMSKGTVDNLSASTSNVETPSQSIIETETNVPQDQNLREMVGRFTVNLEHIASRLGCSPDINAVPFNTSTSSSCKSDKEASTSQPRVIKKSSDSSRDDKEELVAQYAKISDSVTKRIQALTKMIEDLRDEKIKMLQATKSKSFQDKDFSTVYMDLPDTKSAGISKSGSLEEDEILKRLMEIDQSVLDKMGKIRQHSSKDADDIPSPNSTDREIINRLQRLKEPDTEQQQSFVPFLSDIPILPKFEPQPDTGQLHKRPPPSKGLAAAKKFNGNISLMPHELSTIVEGDSQMSTKVPTPDTSDMNLNMPLTTIPEIDFESCSATSKKSSRYKDGGKSSSSSGKERNTSNKDDSTKSSDEIPSSLLVSSSSTGSSSKKRCDDSTCGAAICLQQSSSSSSDDLENIESMLRSIGMDWAIPTLYKTQEALALASSSSSLDLTKKKSQKGEGSGSEISLRDYLRKNILKVSASTMLSDTTPGSFLADQTDVSAIQTGGENSSVEKSRQRTSTPINVSKSTSKSKAVFTDSDLSSIKNDTSKSKTKTKKN